MGKEHGGDNKMTTVKSTINISRQNKEQLEQLVKINELSSVTEGINLAIAEFVKTKQKALYSAQMRRAAQDNDFMERTLMAQKDFEGIDSDCEHISGDSEW